ncbi:hypothetical protein LA080_005645 [Diaporthe eres]|nr:hypothetical protein LA080_005645 [Diaporthe eres]
MAVDSVPSISVHITITIDPSNNEAFLEALKPTFDAATKEPLNTSMEVFQDANTPGVFRIVENWNASIDYMMNVGASYLLGGPMRIPKLTYGGEQVQRNKDYYKPYFAATEPMYLKPLEANVYSRFPGKQWKSIKENQ